MPGFGYAPSISWWQFKESFSKQKTYILFFLEACAFLLQFFTLSLIIVHVWNAPLTRKSLIDVAFIATVSATTLHRRAYFFVNAEKLTNLVNTMMMEPVMENAGFSFDQKMVRKETEVKIRQYSYTFRTIRLLLNGASFIMPFIFASFPSVASSEDVPTICGRHVFFKMYWFHKKLGLMEYILILFIQAFTIAMNLISSMSVDSFVYSVYISQAERVRFLESITCRALLPSPTGALDLTTKDLKAWVAYYSQMESTIKEADAFIGPLVLVPNIFGLFCLLVYGFELFLLQSPKLVYVSFLVAIQLLGYHNAGELFINNAERLGSTLALMPLKSDEGMVPGTYKSTLMILSKLCCNSESLKGFSGSGYFRISREFVSLVLIGTAGYLLVITHI